MWTFLLSAALGFGFEDAEADSLGIEEEAPDAIVNGVETTDWPAVFTLAAADQSGYIFTFCSGTLVHEEWGVSAAHCVDPIQDYQNQGMTVYAVFGGSVNSPDDLVEIEEGIKNPEYGYGAFIDDISVIHFAEKKKDVTPMVLNDEPIDDSWIGTSLTFVGFGVTGDSQTGSGVKRMTDIPISGYDIDNVYSFDPDTNVCNGDSGGASLERSGKVAELAGINAFVTPSCNGGSNGATRVDVHIDFLKDHIPKLFTDPAQLEEAGDDGAGLPWVVPSVDDDGNGLGGRFGAPEQFHENIGCSSTGSSSGSFVAGILLLLRSRRRLPK